MNQWDTHARLFDEGVGEGGDELHQKLIDPLIFRFLGDFASSSILDVGCGNGYLLKKLAKQAKKVVGIDYSKELVSIAKRHVHNFKNIRIQNVDIVDPLPFPDAMFDVVIANMVLQYVPTLETFALSARHVLKPGDLLIIIIDHPVHSLFFRAQALTGKKETKFIENKSYFKPGLRRKKSLWDKAILNYFHRPLKDYSNVFTPHFKLEELDELSIDNEIPRIAGFKWKK